MNLQDDHIPFLVKSVNFIVCSPVYYEGTTHTKYGHAQQYTKFSIELPCEGLHCSPIKLTASVPHLNGDQSNSFEARKLTLCMKVYFYTAIDNKLLLC